MSDRVEQLGIDANIAGQLLRVNPVILVFTPSDSENIARIGRDHFMTDLTEDLIHPSRVRAGFYGDPQRLDALEACLERLDRSTQPFLNDFTIFVEDAKLAELVAEINTNQIRVAVGNNNGRAFVLCSL